MSDLRPYQLDLVERCAASFANEGRCGVMQLATGGGKTHTAAEILRRAVTHRQRAIFCAHLDTLIGDTHARLTAARIPAGFVQAGRAASPLFPVQVCSIDTLHARGETPPANLVILDECHRAAAPKVRAILARYPDAWILGLTATPQRGDGQPLESAGFSWMQCGPSVRDLTAAGSLVRSDVLVFSREPTERLSRDPVEAYLEFGEGRRAMLFAADTTHARALVAGLEAASVSTRLVTGETPRKVREEARALTTSGAVRALVSVDVFREGFDLPAVEVVVLARGMTTVASYLQSIGRGLRPSLATGKRSCLVLDLKGASYLWGLPDEDRAWSISGKPRRTEKLQSLRRCEDCFALFRPMPECPRCGAVCETAKRDIPRILTRVEKHELLSALPQEQRDRKYMRTLIGVGLHRLGLDPETASGWAQRKFRKQFGRQPSCAL